MDELDAQLMQDLAAQREQSEQPEQPEAAPEVQEAQNSEEAPQEEEKPKVFDESYVKALRQENAKYRRQLRDTQASIPNVVQNEINRLVYGNQQPQQTQQQQTQQVYDPRVDDMILQNKLAEVKNDPYFSEIFSEVDDEGVSFEEKLLQRALDTGWPVSELDALVFKMEKEKLLGKVKQKAIDEAYKSMSTKAQNSGERVVASGKTVEEPVNSLEDAIKKSMKDHGVTNLSELR